MAKPILTADLIDEPPVPEKPRRKKATPEQAAKYTKSISMQMTEADYKRWRKALIDNDRQGQELLTELMKKWMDRMAKKAEKALAGEDLGDDDQE